MTLLDWRDAKHWGGRLRLCRLCGKRTPLLDTARRPTHKVCLEDEISTLASRRRAGGNREEAA